MFGKKKHYVPNPDDAWKRPARRLFSYTLFVLILLFCLLFSRNIFSALYSIVAGLWQGQAAHPSTIIVNSATPTPTSTPGRGTGPQAAPTPTSSVVITRAHDGELLGVSDGSLAFDTGRPDGADKLQATKDLPTNPTRAIADWEKAIAEDPSDAEARIYLADQQLQGSPYITLVIATVLTGPDAGVGRSVLQGAYVAQDEYNSGFELYHDWKVRLLVANAGSHAPDAKLVANQILARAQADGTIVGVVGWSFSEQSQQALQVFRQSQLFMASYAGADTLTGTPATNNEPAFFRVAPPNSAQAAFAASYAQGNLHAQRALVFEDKQDLDSQELAEAFARQMQASGDQITRLPYTTGDGSSIKQALNGFSFAQQGINVIYFPGRASDASTLLLDLAQTDAGPDLPLLGSNALYDLNGYADIAYQYLSRLRLTAYAYPDEWGFLGPGITQPSFFSDYTKVFQQSSLPTGTYGSDRTSSDVMLSYDSTEVILQAAHTALASQDQASGLSAESVRQALIGLTGTAAFQGVSGQIAFEASGESDQKELVMLCVSQEKHFTMIGAQGAFFVGGTERNWLRSIVGCH